MVYKIYFRMSTWTTQTNLVTSVNILENLRSPLQSILKRCCRQKKKKKKKGGGGGGVRGDICWNIRHMPLVRKYSLKPYFQYWTQKLDIQFYSCSKYESPYMENEVKTF
jgi:hypothetical protein